MVLEYGHNHFAYNYLLLEFSMTFTPGNFYVDPVSEITYLCAFYDSGSGDFVYWNDDDNEFTLVEIDNPEFKLKDVQEWE